jgi:hypothetical protein
MALIEINKNPSRRDLAIFGHALGPARAGKPGGRRFRSSSSN